MDVPTFQHQFSIGQRLESAKGLGGTQFLVRMHAPRFAVLVFANLGRGMKVLVLVVVMHW